MLQTRSVCSSSTWRQCGPPLRHTKNPRLTKPVRHITHLHCSILLGVSVCASGHCIPVNAHFTAVKVVKLPHTVRLGLAASRAVVALLAHNCLQMRTANCKAENSHECNKSLCVRWQRLACLPPGVCKPNIASILLCETMHGRTLTDPRPRPQRHPDPHPFSLPASLW